MQLVRHGLGFIRREGDLWELLGQQREEGARLALVYSLASKQHRQDEKG